MKAWLLATAFVVGAPILTWGQYSDGNGTEENPYIIATVADWDALMNTREHWSCHFRLVEDLDMEDVGLIPIGWDDEWSFSGSFDGNDHTIRNVTITTTADDYYACAPFGWIGPTGTIDRLRLENVNVSGPCGVGGLAGFVYGRITNCSVQGSAGGNLWVGGLIAYGVGARLLYCQTDVSITGVMGGPMGLWTPDFIGGIAGELREGGVANSCHSAGPITTDAKGSSIGGLVGYVYRASVAGSTAVGTVCGREDIGGLVGRAMTGNIWECQAAGVVQGGKRAGGLIGSVSDGTVVRNCRAVGPVSGTGAAGGLIGKAAQSYVHHAVAEGAVAGTANVGGLIGLSEQTQLSDCHASGKVDGDCWIGGLVGYSDYGQLDRCTAAGDVTGVDGDIGGLIGSARSTHVTACRAEGNVSGGYRVGGLIGWADQSFQSATISHCVATGDVTGTHSEGCIGGVIGRISGYAIEACRATGRITGSWNHAGGLIGYGYGNITDCHATVAVTGRNYVGGLVGYLSGNSVVTNSHAVASVESLGPSTTNYLAGLIGYAGQNSSIQNCYAAGEIMRRNANHVGGLVGQLESGLIDTCYSEVAVIGYSLVGGFVGHQSGGAIWRCYATGSVQGSSDAGGFAGRVYDGTISDCYAAGDIGSSYVDTPVRDAGGFVGRQHGSSGIERCYATGQVTGREGRIGGFSAILQDAAVVEDSFWDTQTSGLTVSAAGTGLTTVEMQRRATFHQAGWVFVDGSGNGTADTWRMCVDDVAYPQLAWTFARRGDFRCPDGAGMEDLCLLAGQWLTDDADPLTQADATGDGRSDLFDLAIVAENWLASPAAR